MTRDILLNYELLLPIEYTEGDCKNVLIQRLNEYFDYLYRNGES